MLSVAHFQIVNAAGLQVNYRAGRPSYVRQRGPGENFLVLQWWLTHHDGKDKGYCAGEEREQPLEVHSA